MDHPDKPDQVDLGAHQDQKVILELQELTVTMEGKAHQVYVDHLEGMDHRDHQAPQAPTAHEDHLERTVTAVCQEPLGHRAMMEFPVRMA